MVGLWPRVPHVHHRLRDWQHGPASCGPSHVTKCLGRTITDAFESSRQQHIITHVQTLKARKRWKIETSSCLQTLQDGSNFQTSGSSNASGGCGEQQTSISPVLPFFFAPQNKSFPKNKIVLGKVFFKTRLICFFDCARYQPPYDLFQPA